MDSKEPTADYEEFIKSETRYTSLAKQFPEIAESLFQKAQADAKARLESYKRLAGN